MLATLAEFPHPGSIAWVRATPTHPGGDKVRILEQWVERDTGEAHALIAYQDDLRDGPHILPSPRATTRGASGNTRVPLSTLTATRDEALKPAHPEEAVRPSRAAGDRPVRSTTAQPRRPRRSAR